MMQMTPKEWYNKKRVAYLRYHNKEWTFVPWEHSLVQETLMRMGVERSYFGFCTLDEDVLIANAVLMRERTFKREAVSNG